MNPALVWHALADAPGIAALINHLWQSTAVALAAALLTLALRGNRASVRYWLWLIASLSFLFPFSLLVTAGGILRPAVPAAAQQYALAPALEQIAEPFPVVPSPASNTGVSAHSAGFIAALLFALWACGALFVAVRWMRSWLTMRSAIRCAMPHAHISASVPVLETSSHLEPGVFGIVKPVLLFPAGIEGRLTGAQLDAIVAHEMCHVRRRDNLTFALHQLVQALFWFHPLVWFIGTRLIDERERACDEAAVETGNDSATYAEGILNVCRFFVESPAACVAGVSGSDLKKRIVRILRGEPGRSLNGSRKILLCAAGIIAVAIPFALGVLHSPQVRAQAQADSAADKLPAFEVSTVKPTKADEGMMRFMFTPDGISLEGTPMRMMLREAFNVENDQIIGGPDWLNSARFDVQAKVSPEDAPKLEKLNFAQRRAMLQQLLIDRFGLKYHHETRELPVYALVVAKGGLKMKATKPYDPNEDPKEGRHMITVGHGSIEANGAALEPLVHMLSQQLGRIVVDKTGLTAEYEYKLKWTPDTGGVPPGGPAGAPPGAGSAGDPDAGGPSVFTAIEEQLGLKLVSEKAPVDVIVIDHVDKPSEN